MSPKLKGGFDLSHLLTVVITAVFAVGVTIAVDNPSPTPENPSPHHTVSVTLGGPKKTKIPLDPKAQAIVKSAVAENAAGDTIGSESDLHETKLPSAVAAAQALDAAPPGQPAIPAHVPLAAQSQPGCRSAFVRNYSSRHGAPIDLGVIHWTGSPITSGPSGGLAIVRWFDTPAAEASSTDVTDQEGRCWYTVPETAKAWTQAAANPWSVSVEIVNPGVLPLFRTAAARNTVLRLMVGWHRRWGIPYRIGAVNSNCVPIRSGFLAHRDLGRCGGGHPDVGVPSAVPSLVASARALDAVPGLRVSHATVHRRLRASHCSILHPKHRACRVLVGQNDAIHRAAKRAHVKLG
jgi:hypothetical protein